MLNMVGIGSLVSQQVAALGHTLTPPQQLADARKQLQAGSKMWVL